jgi:hypothetical protein
VATVSSEGGEPQNRPPVLAAIGDRTVDEGAALNVPMSAADPNEGDTLAFSTEGLPGFCTLTDQGDGTASLACAPGYTDAGVYAVTVTVADSGDPPLEDSEQFTLTVKEVTQPPPPPSADCAGGQPEAVADAYQVGEDGVLVVTLPGVLVNDINPSGGPISAVKVSPAFHGTLSFSADGTFSYTPEASFSGTDSFTYRAYCGGDTNPATAPAVVTITVVPANDPPAARDNTYQVYEDTPAALAAPGVLENDWDVDGDPLTAVLVSGVSHGTLVLDPGGSFTYTGAPNFNGVDSFTYRASDGSLDSGVATVTLNVAAVNDAPVAAADAYGVAAGGVLSVAGPGILANDADADGNVLTAVQVTAANNGTVLFSTNGSFTYTPKAGFVGTDSFLYKAHDGAWESNVVKVSITVAPPSS